MSNENERRDFLKMAGAAVAGITVTTIASGEAGAAPIAGRAAASRTVVFHCREGVSLDSIQKAIGQTVGKFGCLACGLLGVDLHFHLGDPEPFNVDVPGIKGQMM